MSAKDTKSYQVEIFGDQYSLTSDESSEKVLQVAALVDSLMKEISAKSSMHDKKILAVMAALKISSSLLDLQELQGKANERYDKLICRLDEELSV